MNTKQEQNIAFILSVKRVLFSLHLSLHGTLTIFSLNKDWKLSLFFGQLPFF